MGMSRINTYDKSSSAIKIQSLYRGRRVRKVLSKAVNIYNNTAHQIESRIRREFKNYRIEDLTSITSNINIDYINRVPLFTPHANIKSLSTSDDSSELIRLTEEAVRLEKTIFDRIKLLESS